jgi:hypothetical protein
VKVGTGTYYCDLHHREVSSTKAIKHDSAKPRLELLSKIALWGTAQVLTYGAVKYSPHNWRHGLAWARVLGACMRHLTAFMDGEDLDEETGLPHIDHLACEVMFMQELYRTHKDMDDRWNPSK